MEKTTLPIHFEDRSGQEFERLTFAYFARQKKWDKIDWLGQVGKDGGRDIWGEYNNESYCYQCANYQNLTENKAKDDIDKLITHKTIPDNLIIVCGGRVSNGIRRKATNYANSKNIKKVSVISGVEFEELLRKNSPELIKRFVEGETFPETPSDLIKLATSLVLKNDKDIIELIAECFDRPAFTTYFRQESSIPNFEKAINDTIEVLNTGVHRLRDGTIIRTIPSRHRITDQDLKNQLAIITKLVVKLRDNFIELRRKNEIKPCGCNQPDCPVWFLSDHACKVMDNLRRQILDKFRKIKPDFNVTIGN